MVMGVSVGGVQSIVINFFSFLVTVTKNVLFETNPTIHSNVQRETI